MVHSLTRRAGHWSGGRRLDPRPTLRSLHHKAFFLSLIDHCTGRRRPEPGVDQRPGPLTETVSRGNKLSVLGSEEGAPDRPEQGGGWDPGLPLASLGTSGAAPLRIRKHNHLCLATCWGRGWRRPERPTASRPPRWPCPCPSAGARRRGAGAGVCSLCHLLTVTLHPLPRTPSKFRATSSLLMRKAVRVTRMAQSRAAVAWRAWGVRGAGNC